MTPLLLSALSIAILCFEDDVVGDTGLCKTDYERAGMPFAIRVAPLANGELVAGSHFQTVSTSKSRHEVTYTPTHGTRRYTFAIVPGKDPPYVPTEGETRLTLCDKREDITDPNDPEYCPTGVGAPNTLSLFGKDGQLRSLDGQQAVLGFSEGAYVEGVIRIESVTPAAQVVARRSSRPRAP